MFDKYMVKLKFKRAVLGTVPTNPVFQNFVIQKANGLISENAEAISAYNNRFAGASLISPEKTEDEMNKVFQKLEQQAGRILTEEERQKILLGEEVEGVDPNKGITGFFFDYEKGLPVISTHMVYGFLKSASEAICRTRKEKKNGVMLHSATFSHSMINQYVRCDEQFVPFSQDILRNKDGSPAHFERALRAITAKGPRITLVKSELVPGGTHLRFQLNVWKDSPITQEILKTMFDYGAMVGLGQFRSAGFGMFDYELNKLK